MLSVADAFELVGQQVRPLAETRVSLGEALGLTLAESVTSNQDSPPFDKSMLDGYAIDVGDGSTQRRIIERVIAGGIPEKSVEPGTTILVMTGAPIPRGANAVVKHEETQLLDETTVQFPDQPGKVGAGIFRQGSSFQKGQVVLQAGKRVRSIELALLAEVGSASVAVVPRPRVAVLATGNEIVECDQPPAAGQIRNSNGPMLVAAVTEVGGTAQYLGIARDDPEALRSAIARGLESDVLLITGGVSAGVMDLVPGVLQELGVVQVFHKIRMKPGKPLWFGVRDSAGRRTLVFGLPGNPVSTLVTFQLFVKPVIEALAGAGFQSPATELGKLLAPAKHRGDRPTYHPCHIVRDRQGQALVEPLAWGGSSDLAALARANGLVLLGPGEYELSHGAEVEVMALYCG